MALISIELALGGEEFSVQSSERERKEGGHFPLSACGEAVSWDRDYKELQRSSTPKPSVAQRTLG